MLRRLRKFLETNGMRISIPDERNFESEGEVIESGLRRTIEGRDGVMCSLVRAVCRFRDAALVTEKKDNFGNALQNLYEELERAENVVGPRELSSEILGLVFGKVFLALQQRESRRSLAVIASSLRKSSIQAAK
jgi:hypothetical protein